MSHINRDTQSLSDILRFVLTFERRHREGKKQVSAVCAGKLNMWRRQLVAWLAKAADKTVLGLYLNSAESRDQLAPAIRYKKTDKRKYTLVSVEAKWETLEDSRAARTDPVTALALRSKLTAFGCHQDAADSWMRKEQAMYWKGVSRALSSGASHAS